MNKALKWCALFGAVLLVAGILLFSAGMRQDDIGFAATSGSQGRTVQEPLTAESMSGVRNIQIDVAVGELTLKPGDAWALELGTDIAKNCSYSVQGDTFSLIEEEKHTSWFRRRYQPDERKIILTFPKDVESFDQVTFEAGVGAASLEGLRADELEIESGAGSTTVRNSSARVFTLGGGVGETVASGLTVSERSDIDCGVGRTEIAGDLLGEITVSGGVGEVVLDLAGTQNDYTVRTSTGVGEIRVGDLSVGMFGDDGVINKGAPNSMELSCGVGSIRVRFDQ